MIELNCSYEESKKILELGYDFQKICTKFEVKTDIEYQVCHGVVITSDKWNRVEIESSRVIQDEGKLEHGQRIAFNPLLIPIIPKAALEACLITCIVDCEQKRIFYLSYDRHKKPIYRRNYETPTKTIDTIYTEYESAFEAFIWLHEHYPEELKAKFEEVMG